MATLLEFLGASLAKARPPLMASAAQDNTEYTVKMPPLTFLRHFREVMRSIQLTTGISLSLLIARYLVELPTLNVLPALLKDT